MITLHELIVEIRRLKNEETDTLYECLAEEGTFHRGRVDAFLELLCFIKNKER